jgi:hypothetical protein
MTAGFALLSAVCITGLLIVIRQLRLVRSRHSNTMSSRTESPSHFESSAGGPDCATDIGAINCP